MTISIPTLIFITIVPIEEEWAIMASKYRYGIDINKAIKDKLVKFV